MKPYQSDETFDPAVPPFARPESSGSLTSGVAWLGPYLQKIQKLGRMGMFQCFEIISALLNPLSHHEMCFKFVPPKSKMQRIVDPFLSPYVSYCIRITPKPCRPKVAPLALVFVPSGRRLFDRLLRRPSSKRLLSNKC